MEPRPITLPESLLTSSSSTSSVDDSNSDPSRSSVAVSVSMAVTRR